MSIYNDQEKSTCIFGLKFISESPLFNYLAIKPPQDYGSILLVLFLICVIRIY